MLKQYVLDQKEVDKAYDRLSQLRRSAMLCRAAGDTEGNREFYLRAKGFQEALDILGFKPLQ